MSEGDGVGETAGVDVDSGSGLGVRLGVSVAAIGAAVVNVSLAPEPVWRVPEWGVISDGGSAPAPHALMSRHRINKRLAIRA